MVTCSMILHCSTTRICLALRMLGGHERFVRSFIKVRLSGSWTWTRGLFRDEEAGAARMARWRCVALAISEFDSAIVGTGLVFSGRARLTRR
jgi:hypothetical protein